MTTVYLNVRKSKGSQHLFETMSEPMFVSADSLSSLDFWTARAVKSKKRLNGKLQEAATLRKECRKLGVLSTTVPGAC